VRVRFILSKFFQKHYHSQRLRRISSPYYAKWYHTIILHEAFTWSHR